MKTLSELVDEAYERATIMCIAENIADEDAEDFIEAAADKLVMEWLQNGYTERH